MIDANKKNKAILTFPHYLKRLKSAVVHKQESSILTFFEKKLISWELLACIGPFKQ
jgi:hypothetical protein